ncbi:MAG: hypothetical protein RLZZ507_1127 [Cyanobacteriota bacterium]|jgi:hypothetical protein
MVWSEVFGFISTQAKLIAHSYRRKNLCKPYLFPVPSPNYEIYFARLLSNCQGAEDING